MKKTIYWTMLITFTMFTALSTPMVSVAQAQSAEKQTIAVLSLGSKGGISENEAGTLADRLRTELVNLGHYTVVERGRMNAILQEQGFNMSGCTSSECAVEAGRLLGVQFMVAGDVGKIGDVLTVDMRIFDVATGKIVRALQYDHEGSVSGLLGVMRTIARQLVEGEKDTKVKKGGFPWLWVSIGAVVIGGGAAALLGGGGNTGTEKTDLPQPVWPPTE